VILSDGTPECHFARFPNRSQTVQLGDELLLCPQLKKNVGEKNQRMNEQSNTVHIGFTNCSETGRGSA